jgi:hypothetical protein
MRTMQPRFVEIINTSDTPRELRDPALGAYPDDRATLAAKEKRRVPVATFLRLQHLPYIMRAERYEAMTKDAPVRTKPRQNTQHRGADDTAGE